MLIAIDGINGSGKTTQAKLLAERLERADPTRKARVLVDPGVTKGHDAHTKIRPLARFASWKHPMTRMLLYQAARCELFKAVAEYRAACEWVVLDRYIPSLYAYGKEFFASREQIVDLLDMCDPVVPDYTVFLLIDPAVGQERFAKLSAGRFDVYEKGGLEVQKDLAAVYQDMLVAPDKYPFIGPEANLMALSPGYTLTIEQVHEMLWKRLCVRYPEVEHGVRE